jgi:hypothetical protein
MHTSEVTVAPESLDISMTNHQELIYIYQERDEKNWVPWEGTTLMTYPQYPSFTPHTVLDWGTYDSVIEQLEARAASPVPFMDRFRKFTGGWIRCG